MTVYDICLKIILKFMWMNLYCGNLANHHSFKKSFLYYCFLLIFSLFLGKFMTFHNILYSLCIFHTDSYWRFSMNYVWQLVTPALLETSTYSIPSHYMYSLDCLSSSLNLELLQSFFSLFEFYDIWTLVAYSIPNTVHAYTLKTWFISTFCR